MNDPANEETLIKRHLLTPELYPGHAMELNTRDDGKGILGGEKLPEDWDEFTWKCIHHRGATADMVEAYLEADRSVGGDGDFSQYDKLVLEWRMLRTGRNEDMRHYCEQENGLRAKDLRSAKTYSNRVGYLNEPVRAMRRGWVYPSSREDFLRLR